VTAIIPRALVAEALGLDDTGTAALPDGDLPVPRLAELHMAFLSETAEAEEPALHPLFWTYDLLDSIVRRNPGLALEVVLACLDRATSPEDVAQIAAGALEDLVAHHGEHVIDRIEQAALASARVRYALSGVWPQGRGGGPVWPRILAARAPGPDMDRGDPLPPA
jgi:hypothetical protein